MDDILKTKNTKSIQGFLWTEKLVDKDRFDKISKTYQLNEFLAKRLLCDKLEELLGIKTKRLSRNEKISKQKKTIKIN